MMGEPGRTRGGPPGGFTLIELLVVLAILAAILGLVSVFLFQGKEASERKIAGAEIAAIKAAIAAYESDPRHGAPPPTSLQDRNVVLENDINLGIESLVVAFHAGDYDGESPFTREDRFANTDGDRSKIPLTRSGRTDLLEYLDLWRRPYIYFRLSDFEGRNPPRSPYQLDEETTIDVAPVRSEVHGGLAGMADGFQIISLGPDGLFGTKDDVVSWR